MIIRYVLDILAKLEFFHVLNRSFFCLGPTTAPVLAQLRHLTGRAAVLTQLRHLTGRAAVLTLKQHLTGWAAPTPVGRWQI